MERRGRSQAADVTLKIPRPLYDRLAQIIDGTGFRSVTEFCVFVLRDVASAHATPAPEPLSRTELEQIRDRLRALGYLEDG